MIWLLPRKTIPALALLLFAVGAVRAQQPVEPNPGLQEPKKANERAEPARPAEPFDDASVDELAGHCVSLETELGTIEIGMLAEMAPEAVRNFLNLASLGAFDSTSFSRIVPGFVVQGGNMSTHQNLTQELYQRSQKTVPDEPSIVKHVRGILSLARPDEPNSASSHFFILVGDGPHLDGKFSAFGKVLGGMEVADQINKAPATGEKPDQPVRIQRALVKRCVK